MDLIDVFPTLASDEVGVAEQDLSPNPALTNDERIDVLELSDMWCIEDVR